MHHVELHDEEAVVEDEGEREAREAPQVDVGRAELGHERVPNAQQAQVDYGYDGVVVERGEIGDGGQRPIDHPLERDAREQQCVGGLQAVGGQIVSDGEDGERRGRDEEDEQEGVGQIVLGLACAKARDDHLVVCEQSLIVRVEGDVGAVLRPRRERVVHDVVVERRVAQVVRRVFAHFHITKQLPTYACLLLLLLLLNI